MGVVCAYNAHHAVSRFTACMELKTSLHYAPGTSISSPGAQNAPLPAGWWAECEINPGRVYTLDSQIETNLDNTSG